MKCLIVGNDRLGKAPEILKDKLGVNDIVHWNGRRKKVPSKLPSHLDLVIIYTTKINHEWAKRVKALARYENTNTLFVRGLADLDNALSRMVA